MGGKKLGKDIICPVCGREFYASKYRLKQGAKYCSLKCFYKNRVPWNQGLTKDDDERLKSVSDKAREQMYREYSNGTRNRYEVTKKANEAVRRDGQPKLKGIKTWISGRTKEDTVQLRNLSDARKGVGNPMFGKPAWNKMSPTKKWWEEREFIKKRLECLERDGHKCLVCGKSDVDLYCDHIIPYRICQNHALDNLQTLCGSCHSKKTVQDIKNYFTVGHKKVHIT